MLFTIYIFILCNLRIISCYRAADSDGSADVRATGRRGVRALAVRTCALDATKLGRRERPVREWSGPSARPAAWKPTLHIVRSLFFALQNYLRHFSATVWSMRAQCGGRERRAAAAAAAAQRDSAAAHVARAEWQRAASTRRRWPNSLEYFVNAPMSSLLQRVLFYVNVNERRRSCACGRSTSGTASWHVRSCGSRVLRRTRRCASSAATSSRATRSRAFRAPRPGILTCDCTLNTRLQVLSNRECSQTHEIQCSVHLLVQIQITYILSHNPLIFAPSCRRSSAGRIKCPYCPVEMDPNNAVELHIWASAIDSASLLGRHIFDSHLVFLYFGLFFVHSFRSSHQLTK